MRKTPRWMREVGWRTLVGALLLGGIIHVCVTLALPQIARGDAFQRMRQGLPPNRMVMLQPPAPGGQPLPFMTPDAFYAICRYDLRSDPVAVSAALAQPGWTLSLHTPQGDNFYVLPAQQSRSDISLVIVQGSERVSDVSPVVRRIGPLQEQIASPSDEGLIIVRAPLRGIAWRAETEATLARASCGPAKRS